MSHAIKSATTIVMSFLMLVIACAFPASATEQKSNGNAFIRREDVLSYLNSYYFDYIDEYGNSNTIHYNIDDLTSDQLDYLVDHISHIGICAFEKETIGDTDGLDKSEEVEKNQITSNALISKYVTFPSNGKKTYTNEEYILASFEKGHTMEYTEDISITVQCTNSLVSGIPNFTFKLKNLPSYGSYEIENMHTDYSSNSAGFSITYTVTKTIDVGVGDVSLPIVQYSSLRSASLLLLRSAS